MKKQSFNHKPFICQFHRIMFPTKIFDPTLFIKTGWWDKTDNCKNISTVHYVFWFCFFVFTIFFFTPPPTHTHVTVQYYTFLSTVLFYFYKTFWTHSKWTHLLYWTALYGVWKPGVPFFCWHYYCERNAYFFFLSALCSVFRPTPTHFFD